MLIIGSYSYFDSGYQENFIVQNFGVVKLVESMQKYKKNNREILKQSKLNVITGGNPILMDNSRIK